jgi:arylsulfatase A-like enzyme
MTRRTLLGSAPLVAAAQATQTPRPATPPNVLFIISDQFRADNLGCMGVNPMNLTPNLDSLARGGVMFRSAMANHPVCAPARGSIFTGQYEEKHGVWRNGLAIDPKAETLATVLRGRGYSANYIGKWHLAPENNNQQSWGPVPREYRGGFLDLWEGANALERSSHPYEGEIYDGAGKPIPFSGVYRDDFLTQRGIDFLRRRNQNQPFLLTMSYLNPHHQNDVDAYVPPKELAGKYRNFFVPQDLRPLPGSWPSQLGDYYGCVTSIDNSVGKLVAELKQQGIFGNTVVLFMSDHGCHFKTRNTEYKRSPHDSSMHIPLIMSGPGFNRGAEVRELVSQVDVTPTILAACGAQIPQVMQGRSLLPLVGGGAENWHDEVYAHMSEYMTGRILRTPRWTYAVAAPKRPGWKAAANADLYVEYMLYDNFADPYQHVNLAGSADTATVSKELRERLQTRMAEAGDARATIEPSWFPYS